jgi:hypothetical protein
LADKHPYSPGGPGGISAAINQLLRSFPKTVDSETLKKLSIAPKNESYIINILRFIGAIDPNGNRTEKAASTFTKSNDEFKQAFEEMIRPAYAGLFELYGDTAWTLPPDKLVSYFRGADQTSDLVGRLQATTFQILAGFAGHGTPQPPKGKAVRTAEPKAARPARRPATVVTATGGSGGGGTQQGDFGLTVRIEVNLPAQGDKDVYDKIFRSIRENLFPNAK